MLERPINISFVSLDYVKSGTALAFLVRGFGKVSHGRVTIPDYKFLPDRYIGFRALISGTCTYGDLAEMGAAKRESQEKERTAYAVSRYCIPRRFSATKATGTHAHTRIFRVRHTIACPPFREVRRSSFTSPLALMNSYLFLDRVPSELRE